MEETLKTDRNVLIIWPITLIGLPLLSAFLLVIWGIAGTIYSNQFTYFISVSGALLISLFAITNTLFNFHTLHVCWSTLSLREKVIFSIIGLLSNAIGSYALAPLWKRVGVKIFSVKDKVATGSLSFLFRFLFIVAILLPAFIASRQF